MTFYEAIEAARQGKVIRRDCCTKGCTARFMGGILRWDKPKAGCDEDHPVVRIGTKNYQWQIVPDPPKTYTFMEAVEMMKEATVMVFKKNKYRIQGGYLYSYSVAHDWTRCYFHQSMTESQWEEAQ